jgi:hypothetical protein
VDKIIKNLDFGSQGLWFPITVSIVLILFVFFVPKKNISWKEIYYTFGIVGFATWISDALIARTLDLIDLGDPNATGIGEFMVYTFVPTSLAILFLNQLTKSNKWKLVIIFTLLSFLIELGMSLSGYMNYPKWFSILSILTFIIAFGVLLPIHKRIISNKELS